MLVKEKSAHLVHFHFYIEAPALLHLMPRGTTSHPLPASWLHCPRSTW